MSWLLIASADRSQVFQQSHGKASPGSRQLRLEDIGPESVLRALYANALLNEETAITLDELANTLTESEVEIASVGGHGARQVRHNSIKKRQRDMTPQETVVTDDENIFQMREAKLARQEESRDGEYKSITE